MNDNFKGMSFWDVQRFIQERVIHWNDLMLLKFEVEKRIHSKSDVVMPKRRDNDPSTDA